MLVSFTYVQDRPCWQEFASKIFSQLSQRKRLLEKYRRNSKNRKSNKTYSCHVKRLSNKCGENSKNDKFNENQNLEREMVK